MELKQKASFFLVVTPGLEDLALKELNFKYPDITATAIRGGIECQVIPEIGFSFNHYLKIPTRVLLRIESFKVKDLPKLFKKISSFNWRPYLKGKLPLFEVSARKSRLIHTGRIEKCLTDAIEKHFEAQPYPKKYLDEKSTHQACVFFRLDNDQATISLDTSGELLHIRGRKTLGNIAPLRETLASALLWMSHLENPLNTSEATLFDPCCGSGTFLYEASNFTQKLERYFAYQDFPFFEKQFIPSIDVVNPFQFLQFIGHDLESELIKHNQQINKNEQIKFVVKDLFETITINAKSVWLITNPPYGHRIKIKNSLAEYFAQMIKISNPDILGILVPNSITLKHPAYKLKKTLEFKNGGLDVKFCLFEKK